MSGASGLSSFACPESKEASVTPGSEILAATSEDGREGDGASQRLQNVLAAEHGGHGLPLQPVRFVLKLLLELRLPG